MIWFLLGCFAWTFIEYGMHHWNGHLLKGRTRFSREHLKHHSQQDYFSPVWRKIAVALTVTGAVVLVGQSLIGLVGAFAFASGIIVGYGVYEFFHWSCHAQAPTSGYGRWIRRHHFAHHFSNPRYNHGLTSPIWDLVFRTYKKPGNIRVPRKRAMGWLIGEDGALKPEFMGDYRLSGRRPGGRVVIDMPGRGAKRAPA
ncbi:MAG: hypothetical protein CMH52_10425 [Myxococcales bacterium]|nr:hypothetical protein [Myxococcales bacterium]|tara:strand:+ start:350 stop:943 length:594 start_codon:yes stop_codon:yes gene_type:complete